MKLIALGGKKGAGQFAKVDDIDYPMLSQMAWHLKVDGYICHSIANPRQVISMHRLIMNNPVGMDVDHKNGNKLDNRRRNLRVCTTSQNVQNQKLAIDNTSGYKGVSWNKRSKKWAAYIRVNYVRIHLGFYIDKIEAAEAYNRAALKYFGQYARLNPIPVVLPKAA